MAGELLIQLIDIGRFRAICPALEELEAARALGPDFRAVLREATSSPFLARVDPCGDFVELLDRILRHPEMELRVFLSPRELGRVTSGLVKICFENGGEFSLVSLVGANWVVLDSAFAAFMDLDWFKAIFLAYPEAGRLAYPRSGEDCYWVLSREDLPRLAAGVKLLLDKPIGSDAVLSAAKGLARLTTEAQSREALTLAYTSLL